jgi:hypothetical protein
MNEAPVIERIDFAVYRDTTVLGWPADMRRLLRVGTCAFADLDLQEMLPGERSFVVADLVDDAGAPVDNRTHAVCITVFGGAPCPRLVATPEAA